MLDVDVIIVNYRSEDLLCDCLPRLAACEAERPGGVIVVDNSPERGLAGRLPKVDVPVSYLPMPGNAGFAAAVNRGLEVATRPWILLLNPDTRPGPGLLSGLVAILRGDPRTAVAAPRLQPFEDAKAATPSACWRDPDMLSALMEYTPLRHVVGGRARRGYHVEPRAAGEPVDCACVQGACFAMSRDWLRRVGPFDARRFFLYWEETDYCRRVRLAGGRVRFAPALVCLHRGGASTANGEQDVAAFWRSFRAYHRKYRDPFSCAVLRVCLIMGIGMECMLAALAGELRHRRDAGHLRYRRLLRARWRAQFNPVESPCAL